MAPETQAALQKLGEYGGVVPTTFPFWTGDLATGIADAIVNSWAVSSSGSYRITFAGEAALYAALTA